MSQTNPVALKCIPSLDLSHFPAAAAAPEKIHVMKPPLLLATIIIIISNR